MSFTRNLQSDIADDDARQCSAAGIRRHDLEPSSFITTTCANGCKAIRPSHRLRRNVSTGATLTGRISTTPISFRCPTNGNIPGTPLGTWRSIAFHSRCWILSLPRTQLVLLTREWYMHPNGQFPAYEWDFGDVNPPVHAWAAWRVFQIDRKQRRATDPDDDGDLAFLERVFHKLTAEFHLVGEPQGPAGTKIFQGGFLGLDNIGVFDRSAPLPAGGHHQSGRRHELDGDVFAQPHAHRARTGAAQQRVRGHRHQVLRTFSRHRRRDQLGRGRDPDFGTRKTNSTTTRFARLTAVKSPLKVRSMVGLIPLFAVETLDARIVAEAAGISRATGMVSQPSSRPRQAGFALAGTRHGRTPACSHCCAATG